MNLFLALFWLICAAMLLTYELTFGPAQFRIRVGNHDYSWAWMMLLLVLYNLMRWRQMRFYRARQRALSNALANERWQRRRASNASTETLDPNFNFTAEPPAPSNRSITDQPPSNGNERNAPG